MNTEELTIILETLVRQAQRAVNQLGEEPEETTAARIRVMTTTLKDARSEMGLDD